MISKCNVLIAEHSVSKLKAIKALEEENLELQTKLLQMKEKSNLVRHEVKSDERGEKILRRKR